MEIAPKSRISPLFVALILTGCGDGGSDSATEPSLPEPTASAISLTAGSDTLDALGASVTIQAQVQDQFGQPMASAPTPTWTSSDAGVANIMGGVATAISNGSTVITATVGSASASI